MDPRSFPRKLARDHGLRDRISRRQDHAHRRGTRLQRGERRRALRRPRRPEAQRYPKGDGTLASGSLHCQSRQIPSLPAAPDHKQPQTDARRDGCLPAPRDGGNFRGETRTHHRPRRHCCGRAARPRRRHRRHAGKMARAFRDPDPSDLPPELPPSEWRLESGEAFPLGRYARCNGETRYADFRKAARLFPAEGVRRIGDIIEDTAKEILCEYCLLTLPASAVFFTIEGQKKILNLI